MDYRGDELEPPDLEELDREVGRLLEAGVEAIAVCFLHSYANPQHERDVAAAKAWSVSNWLTSPSMRALTTTTLSR